MMMNKICKWERFQKVEESQPRGMKGVDYTSRYLLFKICWENYQVQLNI
jgi:hypothetical protein